MTRATALIGGILVLVPSSGRSEPEVPRDVTALLATIRSQFDLPAMAGAIVTGDRLEAIGADGVRERGKPEKVTIDDQWHLGSCTKAMTATLCGMLVEEKKLAWDEKLSKALDGVAMDAAWRDVTLWQLLHHRSGAPANFVGQGFAARFGASKPSSRDERRRLVEQMLGKPPENPPGTKYVYSNAGFSTAGAILEQTTDKAWEELIRTRLFEPLGMKSAGFGPPGSAKEVDQPRGHDFNGHPYPPGPLADNPPAIGPAGTVRCTIGDWAKFVSLHLRGERPESARLLKPETFVKLHEPMGEEKSAAGWIVTERPWAGGRTLTHSGSNTLWFCVTWLAPERDFAVLVTCNQGGEAAGNACDQAASTLIRDHFAHTTKPK